MHRYLGCLVVFLSLAACNSGDPASPDTGVSDDGGMGDAGDLDAGSEDSGLLVDAALDAGPTTACGNLVIESGELCDDGNVEGGDGCNETCTAATCMVPHTHPTIAAAMSDILCPTVFIAAGTFEESLTTSRDVVLRGLGASNTVIDGGGARVLTVSHNVSLVGVQVQNGSAQFGGGIHNTGRLVVKDVVITNNQATDALEAAGGGIYSEGELVLIGTTVSNNAVSVTTTSMSPASAEGGGIAVVGGRALIVESALIDNTATSAANDGVGSRGAGFSGKETTDVIVSNSEVRRNIATSNRSVSGAGIALARPSTGQMRLEVRGSIIEGNEGMLVDIDGDSTNVRGVGLFLEDTDLVLQDTVIEGNEGTADGQPVLGGGLYLNQATSRNSVATIERCTVAGNSIRATGDVAEGAGIRLDRSGTQTSAIRISETSVLRNAAVGDEVRGAGVFLNLGSGTLDLDVVNSTISDNELLGTTTEQGAGVYTERIGGALNLYSTTIADNSATLSGGAFGGGIYRAGGQAVTLRNTAVADNVAENGPDCAATIDAFYSLLSQTVGCTITTGSNNLFDTAAGLGSLGDSGGVTESHVPAVTSPLVGAGDPSGCDDPSSDPLLIDQRGAQRAVGPCDIGAVERQASEDGCQPFCGAVTCSVPGSFATIASALSDPRCARIEVAAGTFAENLTTTRDVTIEGAGEAMTIIDGSDAGRVLTTNHNVVLRDLRIQNGTADEGGGIRSEAALILEGTTVTANVADDATAALGGGIWTSRLLILRSSSISGNRAQQGMATGVRNARGGGIFSLGNLVFVTEASDVTDNECDNQSADEEAEGGGIFSTGNLILTGASTVSGNEATGPASANGGGIYFEFGTFEMSGQSSVSGNTASTSNDGTGAVRGGGLRLRNATFTIADSAIRMNSAEDALVAEGGGLSIVANDGLGRSGALHRSTVDGSSATGTLLARGGGIFIEAASGSQTLLIAQSTISRSAAAAPQAQGGGLHLRGAGTVDVEFVNATVSTNTLSGATQERGAGIYATGSGGGSLELSSTTIAANMCTMDSGSEGGGIWSDTGVALWMRNTALVNNAAVSSPDCDAAGSECVVPGNCFAGAADLGALTDNGGTTETHQIPASLTDTGSATVCVDSLAMPISVDQRGLPRPVNGVCDIGAVEVQAP